MQSAARWLTVVLAAAWLIALTGCGAAEEATPGESSLRDIVKPAAAPGDESAAGAVDMKKVSYCIGMSIGKNAKQADVALEPDELVEGLKAGLGKAEPRFKEEEIQTIMMAFQESLMAQQLAKTKKAADENKSKGDVFLAENGKKEGVKTTASGLQYRVIKAGEGKVPVAADTVSVHYKGRLIDGTQFDSSYDRGEPATFEVGGVIPGWTEALQLMHEGDVWEVTIPAGLAYGERGAGPIPPNSVLVFEVELKKVEAAGAPEPAPETAPAPEKMEPPKTE